MKLKFEPTGHVYTVDGREVPSVTQILAGVGLTDFSRVNPELLERSKDFGTKAHEATELSDKGKFDYFSESVEICSIVDAWDRFKKDVGFVPELIEKPLYSTKYGFAGTPDRIGLIGKDPAIVDIKTGVLLNVAELQLEGYEILALESFYYEKVKKFRKISVQLLQDGSYKMEEYSDRGARTAFLSCLNVYNYKKRG